MAIRKKRKSSSLTDPKVKSGFGISQSADLSSLLAALGVTDSGKTKSTGTKSKGGPNGQGYGNNTIPDYRYGFSDQDRTNTGDEYVESLGFSLGENSNFGAAFENLLNYYYSNSIAGVDENRGKLFEVLLQYLISQDQRVYDRNVTQDQREYEWNLTQDQRTYNNATNSLARMMGAGISRDAAIQMMSGSAGNIGGGSAGGGSAVTGSAPNVTGMQTPGTLKSNRTAMILDSVSRLIDLGMSAGQAYYTTKMQSNAAYMSDQQKTGYDNANYVAGTAQDAIYSGNFTEFTDADKNISNFDDFNTLITQMANDGNKWAQDLVSTPQYQGIRGSYWGRKYFNDYWRSVKESSNYGSFQDEALKQSRARTKIEEFNAEKSSIEVTQALNELCLQDATLEKLQQDIELGNIEIQIAGKKLDILSYQENQERTKNDIFNAAYNSSVAPGDQAPNMSNLANRKGALYAAFAQWSALQDRFDRAFSINGTEENEREWVQFYEKNRGIAVMAATIKEAMLGNQEMMLNSDNNELLSVLLSFFELLKATGGLDVINTVSNVGGVVLPHESVSTIHYE